MTTLSPEQPNVLIDTTPEDKEKAQPMSWSRETSTEEGTRPTSIVLQARMLGKGARSPSKSFLMKATFANKLKNISSVIASTSERNTTLNINDAELSETQRML